jgi:hypothetical protein
LTTHWAPRLSTIETTTSAYTPCRVKVAAPLVYSLIVGALFYEVNKNFSFYKEKIKLNKFIIGMVCKK